MINQLLLQSEERDLLNEKLATASMMLHKRIKLILLYDQGLPTHIAAQQAGFSPSQARYWKHQFQKDRLDIFQRPNRNLEVEHLGKIDFQITPSLTQPGILPEDLMAEAGKKILYFHFQDMVRHESGTIEGTDIEELHDMCVATRRLRAAFDIFGIFFAQKTIAPFLVSLKATGKSLGTVRDLDVSIAEIKLYRQILNGDLQGGLSPLIAQWTAVQDQARSRLISRLNSQEYIEFKDNFLAFLQSPTKGLISTSKKNPLQTTVRYQAPTLIYSRLAGVMAFDAILETASFSQLHALRIEFKKLRYTLEFFKEVLGAEVGVIINQIKEIQDHLGELNDAHVTCQTIIRFLKKWDRQQSAFRISERSNPEPIVNYMAALYSKRYQLMISFPEKWQRFNHPEIRQHLAQAVASL